MSFFCVTWLLFFTFFTTLRQKEWIKKIHDNIFEAHTCCLRFFFYCFQISRTSSRSRFLTIPDLELTRKGSVQCFPTLKKVIKRAPISLLQYNRYGAHLLLLFFCNKPCFNFFWGYIYKVYSHIPFLFCIRCYFI